MPSIIRSETDEVIDGSLLFFTNPKEGSYM